MTRTIPREVLDPQRLLAVRSTGLLDTPAEEAFDRLTRLASRVLRSPYAFVTLVDDTRSFWKSCVGDNLTVRQNPVEESFCQYVIGSGTFLVVDDAATDTRTCDNPSVKSMGVAAWAGFPIRAPTGEVLGSFCVVDTKVRDWSREDVEVLRTLSEAASGEIALRDSAARAVSYASELADAVERSTALARTLQEALLPPHLPDIPGVEIAAGYLPAGHGEVLGDFYDVFQTDASSWSVVLGDVSGKGVPAAKVTALARHTIRAAAMHHSSPSAILRQLNTALVNQHPHGEEGFLTAVYGSLKRTPGGATLTISSGGHTPVLLRTAMGRVGAVGEPGLIIGLFDTPELTDSEVVLHPGDLVLLYSDGVTEARCGQEQFGEMRLIRLLESRSAATATSIVESIERSVTSFACGERNDDIAILALRIQESAPAG